MKLRQQLSNLGLIAVLGGALWIFGETVDSHYAIGRWLFWRYAGYWLAAAAWFFSCLSAGLALLSVLRGRSEPGNDTFALAFPLGVFAFHLAVFLLGLAGWLQRWMFFVLPLLLLASGWRPLSRFVTSIVRRGINLSGSSIPILLFGALGVGLLYVQVLSPEAFSHDARWYHLPLAQQYAIDGAVRRWPEGWWLAAYPHLSSYLYTWAFLLPFGITFDRFELSGHLEVVVFLATLACIPALVRRLVAGSTGRGSWAAIFLFPGILLYDSNLNAGADHIAALWAIPMLLALYRLWNQWTLGNCVLFAIYISAAALTKYSAICIILPPVVALVLRATYLALFRIKSPLRVRLHPLAIVAAVGALSLILTTPHWLKNWLWYGDPVYPILHKHLAVHPWNSDSEAHFQLFSSFLGGIGSGSSKLGTALESAVTFSFQANDWPVLHGTWPVFGSLFTLTSACLPFLKASRRTWGLCIASMLAISTWYWISPQSRYLQVALPWMAACLAAVLVMLWQQGRLLVRTLVCALVGLQIAWGSDVPFFPTHNMANDSPVHISMKQAASGFLNTPNRFRFYGDTARVNELLPKDASLLLHNIYAANLGVRFVNDLWQGGLNYGELGSPSAIDRKLREFNVSHLIWSTDRGLDWTSLAHDMAFANFALNYVTDQQTVGTVTFGKMPASVPQEAFNDRVAITACGGPFRSGWYSLSQLGNPPPGTPHAHPVAPLEAPGQVLQRAGFVVVDPHCSPRLPPDVADNFHKPYKRNDSQEFYVRRRGR